MRKTPTRSKSIAASEGAKDNVTNLASVQSLASDGNGGSGVYVVEREPRSSRAANVQERARRAMNPLLEQVTLVVYGWKSVEPGTLSWVFPSVGAAVAAARAMKNAVRWAIVAGRPGGAIDRAADDESEEPNEALDEARANGSVLVEQIEQTG